MRQNPDVENAEGKVAGLLEVAELLGVPAKWLKAEAAGGRIPVLKIGRRMYFNPAAVERAIAARAAIETVSQPPRKGGGRG